MKKSRYSSPYYARDYFAAPLLPTRLYAGQRTIRQPLPYRRHEDLEFLLVRSGEGIATVNGRSFPVSRGSLLCFGPAHFHKLDMEKGSKLEISECHVNTGTYFFLTACPYYSKQDSLITEPPVLAQLDELRTEQASRLLDELSTVSGRAPIEENQPAFFLLMKLFGLLEHYAQSLPPCPSDIDT